MSAFQGYGKIEETSSGWQLTPAQQQQFKRTKWVVTEKVHGANFCFVLSSSISPATESTITIQCAKRKEILEEGEDFFGHKNLLVRYESVMKKIYLKTIEMFPAATKIFVFGEIFGGKYPHEAVQPVPGVQPVQTGIWYCPGIEFFAFDIAIETPSTPSAASTTTTATPAAAVFDYLDYDKTVEIFQTVKMPLFAEPLFTGTYEKAIEYSLGFSSLVPAKLGLPALKESNKAEGIVVKPLKTIWIDTKKGKERAIIKKKIAEFSENAERYDGAKKWSNNNNATTTSYASASGMTAETFTYEAEALVTSNRLNNAFSKIGRIDDPLKQTEKVKKLLDLFVNDVMDQIRDDYQEAWEQLPEGDKNSVRNAVTLLCKKCIAQYFKQNKQI